MANPDMWKVVAETSCGYIACGGSIEPGEMYDDEADAAQIEAGEEDQSPAEWESV